ncbi:hypothetical protein BH23GEM3_BH23GEM3_15530 [soil metagenome]
MCSVRVGGRALFLTCLFVGSAAVTRGSRGPGAAPPPMVLPPAAAPLLATPIPAAKQVMGSGRLRVQGTSEVWAAPRAERALAMRAFPPPALPSASNLPHTPAGDVDRWVLRLAGSQRADTRRALQRMARYDMLIRHALAERGLPRELLSLALIESHFLPTATSPVGAGGIWQFMPETARGYGLEVSEYVDERRDPIRSTYAAARHLEWLFRQFGSWHLAAAAYNAGDGRVGGVVRELTGRRGGDEVLYWKVRPYLPRETQDYVPKLLAASRIARFPEQFGFHDLVPDEPLTFREISVPGGTPLSKVADAVGVSADAVYELNPHLVRGMTPPGRRWPVRIPAAPPSP